MLYFTLTGELAIVFLTCDLTSGLRSICGKAHNFGDVVVAVKDIKLLNNEFVFQTQLATSLSLFRASRDTTGIALHVQIMFVFLK